MSAAVVGTLAVQIVSGSAEGSDKGEVLATETETRGPESLSNAIHQLAVSLDDR